MSKIINQDIELYKQFKIGKKRPKLKNLFKMLGYVPNPFQQEVIKYIDEKYKEWHTMVFACARRSGKSTAAALLAVLELLIPNSSVGLVAPSNKQLGVIFDEVLKILRKLDLPLDKIDSNGKFIRLQNGSTFRGGSEATVSNLEGISLSLLLVDELFLIPSIQKILGSLSPALSTYGIYEDTKQPIAKTVLLGSVKPNREALEYLNKGIRKEGGYISLKFTAYDNPLLSKEFLEAEKEKLGEDLFKQEYLCEPVFLDGQQVFKHFDYDKNVKDLSYIKQLLDINSVYILGLDIGATDKTSFLLIYVENGIYYVIDGFEISESSESLIAENIKLLLDKYGLDVKDYSYIDPSAKITRIGLCQDYNLCFYPALNNIKESVALLNDLFRKRHIVIDKKLTYLIKQISDLEWKISTSNSSDPFKRVKGHHYDSTAALRYAIYTHYKLNTNNDIVVI